MNQKTISIQAGYIALNDAAILIIAKECGFAEEEGIDLKLHKVTSWATLRDKLAVGLFDAAHLLAPMAVASGCGLLPIPLDIVVPMAMGLGGNMITLSKDVYQHNLGDVSDGDFSSKTAGERLRCIIDQRSREGLSKLKFSVVHPYSAHNFELRFWLAGCGIAPDEDVEIVFLPPSTLPDALRSKAVDGYCVGEPWSSAAIVEGQGVLLTTKAHIWRSSPDKVLGVRRAFAQDEPEAHLALLRSLVQAAQWIEDKDNIGALCEILARDDYIGVCRDKLYPGFSGQILTGFADAPSVSMNDFYLPFSRAALFPWRSHALWFYSQMVRWGHVPLNPDTIETVRASYHPDYLRLALAGSDQLLPSSDQKCEGSLQSVASFPANKGEIDLGPDAFFDGNVFDPDDVKGYLEL